jgi:DNA-nicking Smr family endonuclease
VTIKIIYMGQEERDLFLAAIAGAVPLRERDRVREAPLSTGAPALSRDSLPPPIALTVEGDGVRISGRAPGVSRAQIAELRRGRVHPEAKLDLHGHTAAQAEAALRAFLVEAAALRRRCVLVIHGRGLHSDGVAVLRDTVFAALVGPMSGWVHAFATAASCDGGDGATYVMVRA